jgi:hypothetical protein
MRAAHYLWSPLVRGGGSKPLFDQLAPWRHLSPLCGAWIETLPDIWSLMAGMSPLVRGVDRNIAVRPTKDVGKGRPLCGGVDRNMIWPWVYARKIGRPPCEGVDRNNVGVAEQAMIGVALHARAWIETYRAMYNIGWLASPLVRGRGSKPFSDRPVGLSRRSPLARGRGSKRHGNDLAALQQWTPLVRGRGSKQCPERLAARSDAVAPRRAWIETSRGAREPQLSRPSQAGAD